MDNMSFVLAAASAAASAVGLGSGLGEAQDVAFSFWAAGLVGVAGAGVSEGGIA